jgi:hypothetical protein
MKANRIECGRKQVRPLQHPQHLAREPRQNAPDQQHCGRAVLDIRSAARDLVQGAQCQATAGQVAINSPDAERGAAPVVFAGRPTWAMLALSAAKRTAVV